MSILSQFTDTGRIGTLNNVQLREVILTTGFENSGSALSAYSYSISDSPTALVYASELTGSGAGGYYITFYYTDLTTGKTIITRGPLKTATGSQQNMVLNPINGGIIRRDPTNATTTLFQSLDYGATWSSLGFGTGVNLGAVSYAGGGWYDGTNFAFNTNSSITYTTTNGTSFSRASADFTGLCVPGNNRSAYSGYYFSQNGSTYYYRTSIGGSDTSVAGYYLRGMSRNGRYLMRINSTTYEIQYSNDGGASWSAFSLSSLASQGYYDQISYLPSDDGTFYIGFYSGPTYYYDFSTSKWTSTMGSYPSSNYFSDGLVQMTRGAVGTKECIFRGINAINGTVRGVSIADFPRKFA